MFWIYTLVWVRVYWGNPIEYIILGVSYGINVRALMSNFLFSKPDYVKWLHTQYAELHMSYHVFLNMYLKHVFPCALHCKAKILTLLSLHRQQLTSVTGWNLSWHLHCQFCFGWAKCNLLYESIKLNISSLI